MNWVSVSLKPAPKNIPILINILDNKQESKIIKAVYFEAKKIVSPDDSDLGEYDEQTDTYYCPEGWYEDVYAETGYDYTYHWLGWSAELKVTHWLELKAPNVFRYLEEGAL